MKISDGDMRKMVNTLQVRSAYQNINMALQSSSDLSGITVDRNFVFKLTGFPNPEDIKTIFNLLNQSDDIKKAYDAINDIRKNKGISLVSLLKDISDIMINLALPGTMKGSLYKRMAEIEYRLSLGCSEEKQLASLVGAFAETREILN